MGSVSSVIQRYTWVGGTHIPVLSWFSCFVGLCEHLQPQR